MKYLFSLLVVCALSLSLGAQMPLPNAHAHNDYEHDRPLIEALENGFTSVEADVFLIDTTLYVYHNKPGRPSEARTLENLYLQPLEKWIAEHQGVVYSGYDGFFYLMIDFKTEPVSTYQQLKKVLWRYESILSIVREGVEEADKPVKVFISGNRPWEAVFQETEVIAALDGRPGELGQDIPPALMPVVSDHYKKFFRWKRKARVKAKYRKQLTEFVDKAHAEGKKVRLWAAPDHPDAWRFLQEMGVDLINTDHLEKLKNFLLEKN